MTPAPYAFAPHLLAWVAIVGLVVGVVLAQRRAERRQTRPVPWTTRERLLFALACLGLVVALTWPLAELAQRWSLTALVVQRMLLVLLVAPLLWLGLPFTVIRAVTRPAAIDALLQRLARPAVAIAVVTVVLVGSMAEPLVRAQSSSSVARALCDLAVLGAGLVLWIPVIGRVPGIERLRPVIRFVYLVGQGVIPVFLSFTFILSPHPLYDTYRQSARAIALRPLNDQQVAGFVSKLCMLLVLLVVGAVVLARTPSTDDDFGPEDPLVWADVERQFERADRSGGAPVAFHYDERHAPLDQVAPEPSTDEGDEGVAPPS